MTTLRSTSRLSAFWGVIAIPALLVACHSSAPKSVSETGEISSNIQTELPRSHAGQSPDNTAMVRTQKITFRQPGGMPEFSLQFKSTGGKLLDADGKVIANLILESDGSIKLTDEMNNPVGYVVRTEDSLQIESPKRTKILFSYVQASNGNAVLTRSNGSTVYQLKATDTGYEVESDKAVLYTVLTSKGSGQLQTSDGQTVIMSDPPQEGLRHREILPSAIAIFGFEKLTQPQQAGLAYALSTESI